MYPVASLNSLKNFDGPRVFLLSLVRNPGKKEQEKTAAHSPPVGSTVQAKDGLLEI